MITITLFTHSPDEYGKQRGDSSKKDGSRLIFLLSGMALFLLQACSLDPVRNIDPERPITLSPGTGMVAGSVTAPRVWHYWEISHFRYRKLGESYSGTLQSASPGSNALWIKNHPVQPGGTVPDPGLEQQLGRLFAVELPAGTYEIFQLDMNMGRWLSSDHGLLIHMQPVRFEVRSGEILYIGNLHVRFCQYSPDRRVYRGRVNAGIPSVRDEAQRDLPLLLRKFPALKGSNILPAVIDDTAWQELEKTGLPATETECDPRKW